MDALHVDSLYGQLWAMRLGLNTTMARVGEHKGNGGSDGWSEGGRFVGGRWKGKHQEGGEHGDEETLLLPREVLVSHLLAEHSMASSDYGLLVMSNYTGDGTRKVGRDNMV